MGRRMWGLIAVLGLGSALVSCSGDDGSDGDGGDTGNATEADSEGSESSDDVAEPALRDELLEMMDADQAERTGEVGVDNDGERTARLREIIDEHGWPTFDLVGREGATAAWVTAQHSDQDVELQEEALALLQAAAEDDQVDPSELAYLDDRVAVNNERPQRSAPRSAAVPTAPRPPRRAWSAGRAWS